MSQYTHEPLLKSFVEKQKTVTMHWGCSFVRLDQDAEGVNVHVAGEKGSTRSVRARYVVGYDGGASPVRHALDIKLRGEGNVLGLRQALFRCDELFDKIPIDNGPTRGRHYHVADDKATYLIMQDSTKHWTLHATLDSDEAMKQQFEKIVGVPVKYEMLSCNPWRQNLLLADKYQDRRVF